MGLGKQNMCDPLPLQEEVAPDEQQVAKWVIGHALGHHRELGVRLCPYEHQELQISSWPRQRPKQRQSGHSSEVGSPGPILAPTHL